MHYDDLCTMSIRNRIKTWVGVQLNPMQYDIFMRNDNMHYENFDCISYIKWMTLRTVFLRWKVLCFNERRNERNKEVVVNR